MSLPFHCLPQPLLTSLACSIRPLYVFEKTLATFGTFTLLILIVEHAILPVTPSDGDSFFASMLDLAVPFTACYLLIFFIIFGEAQSSFSREGETTI